MFNKSENQRNNQNNTESSSIKDAISDTAITAAVKAKLLMTENVKSLELNVETNDGVVTLRGNVNDVQNRQTAISAAGEVDGVRDVRFEQKE